MSVSFCSCFRVVVVVVVREGFPRKRTRESSRIQALDVKVCECVCVPCVDEKVRACVLPSRAETSSVSLFLCECLRVCPCVENHFRCAFVVHRRKEQQQQQHKDHHTDDHRVCASVALASVCVCAIFVVVFVVRVR